MNSTIRSILPIFVFLLCITNQIYFSNGDTKLSLKFIGYENPLRLKYNLQCCDGELRNGQCTDGCDHKVQVCIDDLNSTMDACGLGEYDLGQVAPNQGNFLFPSIFLNGQPNPYPINVNTWRGGVKLRISMYDQDTGPSEIIDEFSLNFTDPQPSLEWIPSAANYSDRFTLLGNRPTFKSRLELAVEAHCDQNFYGPDCSVNCVPEDDCMGHYDCNRTTGRKICLPGWTGDTCAIKIPGVNDCASDQSCNSGSCVRQGTNTSLFYCCCDAGFEGDFCQRDIDECANNPCINGGTCFQDRPASFQCFCPLAYTGDRCERLKNCSDSPCLYGGLCLPVQNGEYQCACLGDSTGDFCEISLTLPPTTTKPTTPFSESTTRSTTSSTNVPCQPNYYGANCDIYCKPDETCNSGFYTCDPKTGGKVCRSGWTGLSCDRKDPGYIPDAECPESTCRNSGFCMNSTCCCTSGFTGRLCHIEILECDSNPCANGGKCKDLVGDFSCECLEGFEGKSCQQTVSVPSSTTTSPPSPCQGIVCENGGSCINDNVAGPICLCTRGFYGLRCRNESNTVTSTVCPPNLYGPKCDVECVPTDTCEDGHYDCHYITGKRICLAGWAGNLCQYRFLSPGNDPECPSSGCRNGGECHQGACCCPNGYTGQFCQEEIFYCGSKPCRNGGRCVEQMNGFDCICPTGYSGDLCETNQFSVVQTTENSTGGFTVTGSSPVASGQTTGSTGPFTVETSTVITDNTTGLGHGETSTVLIVDNTTTPIVYSSSSTDISTSSLASTTSSQADTNSRTTTDIFTSTSDQTDSTTSTTEVAETISSSSVSDKPSSTNFVTNATTSYMSLSTSTSPVTTDTEATTGVTTPSAPTSPTTVTAQSPAVVTRPRNYIVETLYLLKWWKFLNEDQVIDILRYATFLTNIRSGFRQDDILVESLTTFDALDEYGTSVSGIVYNASLVGGKQGPITSPTKEALETAISQRGHNVKLYEGSTPWQYVYHYDLYYKAGKTESLRDVISKLTRAWLDKYTEYQNCECTFTIRVPRRVRYLDRNGDIITRYIYFAFVDDILNDPAVKPGPTLPELGRYFVDSAGQAAVKDEANLTQYEDHHEIYLTGEVTEQEREELGDIIKTALLNSSTALQQCGDIQVNVARTETQIDSKGTDVTKVMYTVECDGVPTEPSSNDKGLWDAVDDTLIAQGEADLSVYRDADRLFYNTDAFTLYLNGESYGDFRKALMEAWKLTPDIKDCSCNVTLYFARIQTYIGTYGIQMTGVTYFVSRDDRLLTPTTSTPPSKDSLLATLRQFNIFNTIYKGIAVRPYNLYYSVLTKQNLQKDSQIKFISQIARAWEGNIPSSLKPCTGCSLGVHLARPEIYYSSTGERITNGRYFLKWGSSVIAPQETASPSAIIMARSGVDPCACDAIKRRYIDIESRLPYTQVRDVQKKIQTIWRGINAGAEVTYRGTDEFTDYLGKPVTRVYYTASLGKRDSDVDVDVENISSQLSPYRPARVPASRLYSLYVWGPPTGKVDNLALAFQKAWLETNRDVASDDLTVEAHPQEGDYVTGDDGDLVTKVQFTVTVLDADSSIANVEEPSSAVYETALSESDIRLCVCKPRKTRELYITGTVGDTTNENLETAIANAWKKDNPDFSGTLTTKVISKANGYQSSDEHGTKLTRVVYTVSPDEDRPLVRSTQLSEPDNAEINNELQLIYPDLTTFHGDVVKEKVQSSPDWLIPVVVVVCLLALVIIIVIIILVVRYIRNRKSRTLKRNPNEVRNFDKEHFSAEPAFENPAFDANETNQKPESHYMNMSH